MIDFILSNFETVVGALVALGLLTYAIYTRQWGLVQMSAYKLMLSAERLLKTKPGKARMDEVFKSTWVQLPRWLKLFVTEQTLKEKLQEWYDLAKDYMDDGAVNKSNTITK